MSAPLPPSTDAILTIIAAMADGIVIVDANGITRFVNAAAERLFGRSADDLIGEEFGYPIVQGESAELEILNPTRGPIMAELRVTDTEWEGGPARLAAIRDITERVRAQAREKQLVREQALRMAAEASERRARFLGQASHILASSLDYNAELQNLAELAVPFLADWCIIDVIEPDNSLRRVAVATTSVRGEALLHRLRRAVPHVEPGSGMAAVLRQSEPQLAAYVGAPAVAAVLGLPLDDPALRLAGLGACMVLPLTTRDRRYGVLTLCDAESSRIFDDDDLELASEVAHRAAAAIDNGRLYYDAQQANRAKADFLAVMSHELRTPLNAIIGYADLLMMGVPLPIPDRSVEQVRRIRASARHLLELIEDILSYSRIEAGREQLHIEEVDIATLARDTAALCEPLASRKDIAFHLELPTSPVLAETDAQKLRQILLNLLSNAVKFTDTGHVRLALVYDDRDVSFMVEDTGRGIAAEDHARIFEPFWQVEQSRTRRAEGTGLGLAVTRRFAQLLGGDIYVDSVEGAGSTFTARLPRTVRQRARGAEARGRGSA